MSESDFQQIKDWNCVRWVLSRNMTLRLNPTSNKSRIETKVSLFLRLLNPCLNPTSNKSRIETTNSMPCSANHSRSLNPTSNKSRIETSKDGIIWNYNHCSLNPTSNKSRIETLVTWQFRMLIFPCLNPTSNKSRIETYYLSPNLSLPCRVWIRLPTNQGLKLRENYCRECLKARLNPTSNKSRIETHVTGGAVKVE